MATPAGLAMLPRVRIVAGYRLPQQRSFKALLYSPEIGRVVCKAVVIWFEVGPGRNDVHVFGRTALRMCKQVPPMAS